jgi:hypothetical protein
MILNEKQRQEFEEVVKPVIKWLNNNCNPHNTIIIDNTNAELVDGVYTEHTEEYLGGCPRIAKSNLLPQYIVCYYVNKYNIMWSRNHFLSSRTAS